MDPRSKNTSNLHAISFSEYFSFLILLNLTNFIDVLRQIYTSLHENQMSISPLVYFVEFDKFYPCFTSELQKYAWKSNVKKVLLFILLNLTNFINVLHQNYIRMNESQMSKESPFLLCWIWQILTMFYVRITYELNKTLQYYVNF